MKAEVEILHAKIPMKLHSPHLLRNALLAALLCCTTAFGTVTVTVDGQPSSLEQLSGTPSGSVSITVEGEDATLSHPVTLDNEANHFITVEEGHSLTIMGGLTFSNPWPDGWEHWDGEANILSVRGEIIFAAGESVLVGCMDRSGAGPIIAQAGPIIVQEGARLTLNNAGFLCVCLTVEGGGELVAGDDVNCSALNGKGTLRFSEGTNGREGDMTILGNNAGPANFGGKIDGHGFICVEGYIGDSGETPLNSSRPGVLPTRQIFTNVTAEGVSLDTTIGDVSFAGSENKFRSLAVGDIYNGIITDIDSRNPYPNSLRDTLTIEEGTKVFFGKLFDDPDWHYNEEVGYEKFDPQIYSPVRQRGFSFDMEDRSELLVRFGKGETGAKITASGAIVLKTTTWEEDVSNPIKPAVRVEFAENPGKDLKQLLIQSNGIVLTSIEYGEHTAPDNEGQLHDHLTTFLVTEQYTDESSEDDLNKWLKENVTVTVNGYDDPYLMVEKKGESLIELYVAAGDVADLPDPSEPSVTVTVDGKPSSLEHLSGTPKGSVSITVKGEDATLSYPVTLDGSVDHYITVEEGHSLTIMGGLMYDGELSSDRLSKNTLHLFESSSLSDQGMQGGTIIFAAGESELGRVSGGSGEVIVKKGASLTISDDRSGLDGALTIEEGGNVTVSDMFCMTLNGGGTLTLLKHPVYSFSLFGICGSGGNFSGTIEGEEFVELENHLDLAQDRPQQTFTGVTAQGTKLSVIHGDAVFVGAKNEFKGLQLGSDYNFGYYDTSDNPNKLKIMSTLTIKEGTKVSLGKLLDDPDWHYNEESGVMTFDPQIYKPVKQRGFSFDMEDRSEMVVKYGKGETGAKITASGAIVLKTTTWDEDISNPTKLAVRVEFAENPGKDLKQLLIQANGIVLSAMKYSRSEQFEFTLLEQYTDENSEADLNKWLKDNVTVTVNGYDDPYLMVEKKGESLIELYVAAGDVADLPDPSEPSVTVTVDGKPSSLEHLSGTPKGSVSITVKGEDATLSYPVTLDGSVDHYITVEEGHSLTIMGGLMYDGELSSDRLSKNTLHLFESSSLSDQGMQGGTIIFAAGESELGRVSGGSGEVIVKKGASLTISDDRSYLNGALTIEEGGNMTVSDMGCMTLNGGGTLTLLKHPVDGFSIFTIYGGSETGNFSGMIEGEQFVEIDNGPATVDPKKIKQIFTDVTAKGTKLSVFIGELVLAGGKSEFNGLQQGYDYNIAYYDTTDNPNKLQNRSTLTIEEGTKVSLGKLLDDPDWHYNEESGVMTFDPQIYKPVKQRGFSFDMEDRSEMVVKYGKGETGAKITASGAIVLKTTTWDEDISNPTKLAVRVEFAENPGKDLKQLLIQANGIVLSAMKYSRSEQFEFTLLEQYTDENSEADLNKWLKDNVTVTVNGYDDPYLMVEKKGESLIELYVAAGDVADLPDDPEPDTPGTDTPGTDTPGTDTPGTDTPGTDTPGTDTPGTDTPGTDTPGTDTPGTNTPGTDTPGTDTPGASNPDTIFAPLATSENTQAGAGMLYHAMNHSTSSELQNVVGVIAELAQIGQGGQPAVAMAAMIAEPGTAEMLIKETAIDPVVAKSEAQRLMSAVVGSAVPALGAAQRDAMRGQLSRAASRAARLGQAPAAHGDSGQGMRVWMEGMGGSAKLDRSGDETGYEHNAWGAGVGVEKDLRGGATTVGLSLVASYGDLKVDAADHAEGDLDTYYVNLYTHHRSGSFHHSFVLSAGFSDAEFNRTICGGVAPYVLDYATNGSTNGTGFGAAYELAYDIPLNEQKSSLLQPLIGLSFVTTKMDGYNEGGAGDVGLHVGEQESTLTTLTAGARFVSQCGEQAFSRAAVLALRANVAVDMGDRRSEADVSFLGDRSYSGRVRSAETGVVGAQLGASVNVPVDSNTVLYVNGEADLRSGSNSWNVGAGVSVTF